MRETTYKVRWKGVESGPFTVPQIDEMVESRQLSGASQVNTPAGWVLVQDFLQQVEEEREGERLQAEQQVAMTAEAEKRRLEQLRLEKEQLRLQQENERRRQDENAERQELSNKSSGKKYYLFLEDQKKGPFTADAVRVMANSGKANPQTLVWTDEVQDWVSLSGYPELLGRSAGIPQPPSGGMPPPMNNPYGPPSAHSPYPQHPPKPQGSNGTATTALAFACVSLLIFPPIFGLIAFILGIIGVCVCPNKGYATVALILSIVFPVLGMLIGIAVYQSL